MVARIYAKQGWRDQNVAFIRDVRTTIRGQTLLDTQTGKLRCRVLDLAGEEPSPVWEAYSALLSDPRRLLLVESDLGTYAKALANLMRMSEKDRPQLIRHDAYALASALNHGTTTGDQPKEPLIGVLSLDLVNYAGAAWWTQEGARVFSCIVRPAVAQFGACSVVLNHTLDGRMGFTDTLHRFSDHMGCLRKALSNYARRDVPIQRLIPSDAEMKAAVTDLDFVGPLGAVQIYRSRLMRMATIRVSFSANDFHIWKELP